MYGCKRSDCWFKFVPSVDTDVFAFGKELMDVGGCCSGCWDTAGEAIIEFVFVGVTLGGGVGTETDGVDGLDVVGGGGGGVGFFTGAAVARAVGRDGWAGIDAWLATGMLCPVVTAATATGCWLLLPPKRMFALTSHNLLIWYLIAYINIHILHWHKKICLFT